MTAAPPSPTCCPSMRGPRQSSVAGDLPEHRYFDGSLVSASTPQPTASGGHGGKGRAHRFGDIEQRLAGVVGSTEGEFGLAATCGDVFAGVCLAGQSDLDQRPDLSPPSIAALWVEPEFRSRGIARRLVMDAIAQCAARGADIVYLCARPRLREFYLAMGWRLLEEGVGADQLDVFQMHCDRDHEGVTTCTRAVASAVR